MKKTNIKNSMKELRKWFNMFLNNTTFALLMCIFAEIALLSSGLYMLQYAGNSDVALAEAAFIFIGSLAGIIVGGIYWHLCANNDQRFNW